MDDLKKRKIAALAVRRIVADMADRRRQELSEGWGALDGAVQKSIKSTWADLVREAITEVERQET